MYRAKDAGRNRVEVFRPVATSSSAPVAPVLALQQSLVVSLASRQTQGERGEAEAALGGAGGAPPSTTNSKPPHLRDQ